MSTMMPLLSQSARSMISHAVAKSGMPVQGRNSTLTCKPASAAPWHKVRKRSTTSSMGGSVASMVTATSSRLSTALAYWLK
ncbi:MAG: hypothetical protein OXN95_00470 [bacterium]|nr:hypothetical protein [bacterium]